MRSKTEKIYYALKKELAKDGPNVLLPTERQLCERFSAGRSSIRTALHQLELDGYIRSRGFHSARQVSIPKQKMGKVFVLTPPNALFRKSEECLGIFSGICNSIYEKHGEILPFFRNYDTILEELCKHFDSKEYNGAIFIENHTEWYEKLSRLKIPVVIANHENEEKITSTRVDFRMMGRMTGLELLKKGYRRIAIIGRSKGYINDEIAAGLRGALAEEKLWLNDDDVIPYDYYDNKELSRTEAELQLTKLLTRPERPQAFFVFRYLRTPMLFSVAKQLKIKIPEELGIIVYDAPQCRKEDMPLLSIMEEPLEELGKQAVELLTDYHYVQQPEDKKLLPLFVDYGTIPQIKS